MDIRAFPGGPFVENGYLVVCGESGAGVVIDPGATAGEIAAAIRDGGVEVEAVLLTHAHLDHVEGLAEIRAVTSAPVFLHPDDRPLFDRLPEQAAMFGLEAQDPAPPDRELASDQEIVFGSCRLRVRVAPGHAPGHVILVSDEEGVAFVGDVVFQGSIGRTDLPGGDFQRLMRSIREEVLTLPDDTRLLTGHGPETTVGRERTGNPFLIPHYGGELA